MFPRKPYFSPRELGSVVGVSHDTVLRMIHDGRLYAVCLGPKTYRVPLGAALKVFAPDEIRKGKRTTRVMAPGETGFEDVAAQEITEREEALAKHQGRAVMTAGSGRPR